MNRHKEYCRASREAFQKATICGAGTVVLIALAIAAAVSLAPAIAIGCACAAVLCGFGFAINSRDYRENERRAWMTRPRFDDYEL